MRKEGAGRNSQESVLHTPFIATRKYVQLVQNVYFIKLQNAVSI